MEIFDSSPWPGVLVWVLLSSSDYYLTLLSRHFYSTRAKDIFVFEGSFELNPVMQKEVDAARLVSPRFIVVQVTLGVLFWFLWKMAMEDGSWPTGYFFTLGALIGLHLAVHMRHLRNLFLFASLRTGGGIRGHVEYPRVTVLRLSAFELLTFGGLFGLIFVLTENPLLLGAVVSCCGAALHHCVLAQLHARRVSGASRRTSA